MNKDGKDRNSDILTDNLGNVPEKHNIEYILDKVANKDWHIREFNAEYTWSNKRATYYIESILLKYEMQPFILYRNNNINVVCDGFNRIMTLQRFFENKLTLVEEGLHELKSFSGMRFEDFDKDYKNYLLKEVMLSIKQFSVHRLVDELDFEDDEYIEKQLYIRYNSGIGLKAFQMQKASFYNEKITSKIVALLKSDKILVEKLINMRILNSKKRKNMIDEGMVRIREILASIYCPLGTYLSIKEKDKRMTYAYLPYLERENADEVVNLFINVTNKIDKMLKMPNFSNYDTLQTVSFVISTYWLLSILEKDHLLDLEEFDFKGYIDYCGRYDSVPSYFRKINNKVKSPMDRYSFILSFMKKMYGIDMNNYLINKMERKWSSSVIDNIPSFKQLKNIQYHVEAGDTNVEQLIRDMESKMYILRGPYQRYEEVNLRQASRIIESILMDVPFPDIIVYQEEINGKTVNQILDGQQRILTLISFMGKEYLNENGEFEKTEKHQFKLKKLKVLTYYNDYGFNSGKKRFSKSLQDKILHFHIPLQIIKKENNKNYSPQQNFKRINEGINNLKEHCYRLWSVDCDKLVMRKIEEKTLQHTGNEKVFPKIKDPKKKFGTIMTKCIYHTYHNDSKNIQVRKWRNIGNKDITTWLENINDSNRREYMNSIEEASRIFSSIEKWLNFIDIPLHDLIHTQRNNLGINKATQLYYLLEEISETSLIHNAYQVADIIDKFYKNLSVNKDKNLNNQTLLFETKIQIKRICSGVDQDKILV